MLEPVTLDQLRILMAIAETGSFSAAARRLSRAQSAISHAVEGLETALGVALFDRTGRARKLTEAGRILLEDAKAVVSRTEELRARARSMGQGIEPELSLAVDVMFPTDVVIESIRALQSAFPSLPVTLHTEGIDAVDLRVREGTVLLGISPEIDRLPNDGLERRFLTEITLVSVVSAEHPLARYPRPIPIKELERHVQLVLSERDWLVARAQGKPVSSVFRGVVSPRAWRFVDLGTRYSFLKAGFGFCNMPLHMVAEDIAAGRLKQIVIESWGKSSFTVPHYLVLRRGREPGRAVCWLIGHLQERFAAAAQPDAVRQSADPLPGRRQKRVSAR
ncbi:MAG: LysR family transcriptional regulator [Dongiales bacterium]